MSKSPWVILDAVEQVMRCNRCGDTEPLSLINGRRVDMACKIMNGFRELHDDCKELTKDDVRRIIDKTDMRRILGIGRPNKMIDPLGDTKHESDARGIMGDYYSAREGKD